MTTPVYRHGLLFDLFLITFAVVTFLRDEFTKDFHVDFGERIVRDVDKLP